MARDDAYRKAEKRIEKALRERATELNLSAMNLSELPESLRQLTQEMFVAGRQNDLPVGAAFALPYEDGAAVEINVTPTNATDFAHSHPSRVHQTEDLLSCAVPLLSCTSLPGRRAAEVSRASATRA